MKTTVSFVKNEFFDVISLVLIPRERKQFQDSNWRQLAPTERADMYLKKKGNSVFELKCSL